MNVSPVCNESIYGKAVSEVIRQTRAAALELLAGFPCSHLRTTQFQLVVPAAVKQNK
jgi:hypothetical protein